MFVIFSRMDPEEELREKKFSHFDIPWRRHPKDKSRKICWEIHRERGPDLMKEIRKQKELVEDEANKRKRLKLKMQLNKLERERVDRDYCVNVTPQQVKKRRHENKAARDLCKKTDIDSRTLYENKSRIYRAEKTVYKRSDPPDGATASAKDPQEKSTLVTSTEMSEKLTGLFSLRDKNQNMKSSEGMEEKSADFLDPKTKKDKEKKSEAATDENQNNEMKSRLHDMFSLDTRIKVKKYVEAMKVKPLIESDQDEEKVRIKRIAPWENRKGQPKKYCSKIEKMESDPKIGKCLKERKIIAKFETNVAKDQATEPSALPTIEKHQAKNLAAIALLERLTDNGMEERFAKIVLDSALKFEFEDDDMIAFSVQDTDEDLNTLAYDNFLAEPKLVTKYQENLDKKELKIEEKTTEVTKIPDITIGDIREREKKMNPKQLREHEDIIAKEMERKKKKQESRDKYKEELLRIKKSYRNRTIMENRAKYKVKMDSGSLSSYVVTDPNVGKVLYLGFQDFEKMKDFDIDEEFVKATELEGKVYDLEETDSMESLDTYSVDEFIAYSNKYYQINHPISLEKKSSGRFHHTIVILTVPSISVNKEHSSARGAKFQAMAKMMDMLKDESNLGLFDNPIKDESGNKTYGLVRDRSDSICTSLGEDGALAITSDLSQTEESTTGGEEREGQNSPKVHPTQFGKDYSTRKVRLYPQGDTDTASDDTEYDDYVDQIDDVPGTSEWESDDDSIYENHFLETGRVVPKEYRIKYPNLNKYEKEVYVLQPHDIPQPGEWDNDEDSLFKDNFEKTGLVVPKELRSKIPNYEEFTGENGKHKKWEIGYDLRQLKNTGRDCRYDVYHDDTWDHFPKSSGPWEDKDITARMCQLQLKDSNSTTSAVIIPNGAKDIIKNIPDHSESVLEMVSDDNIPELESASVIKKLRTKAASCGNIPALEMIKTDYAEDSQVTLDKNLEKIKKDFDNLD